MSDTEILPGQLELYCGPMSSGKTKELLLRLDALNHRSDVHALFFRPKKDTRKQLSRIIAYEPESIFIANPEEILNYVNDTYNVISIDEIMLFTKEEGIINVIERLLQKDMHVIAAGLDTNFRGEPFGAMDELMKMAYPLKKLSGICKYNGNCNRPAIRTQRLIHGQPAPYIDEPLSIEGAKENETYECRCLKHHYVPK